MKIALCVGHSRFINGKRDGGAVSVGKVNEWTYNLDLAKMVSERLSRHEVIIVSAYQGNGYTSSMRWLAGYLKEQKADVAIELHFNAAGPTARGHEWLYYHNSGKGLLLAKSLNFAMKTHVPEALSRGTKPLDAGDRGNEFVKLTHCPAVIGEPFFGSSASDWRIAVDKKPQIADAYAEGLTEWGKMIQ